VHFILKKITILLLLISISLSFNSCKKEYEKGTLTSTIYESEFLNLKFNVPTGYTLNNGEDDIVSVAELVTAEDVEKFFSEMRVGDAKADVIYEMEATTLTLYPNIAVTLEELPDSDMTIDAYIEAIGQNASVSDEKFTIAGEEYIKFTPTTLNDLTTTMDCYCKIQDGYLVTIMITYTSDTASQKDTLLNAFTALK
jgi:hypothetical protein